MLHTLSIAGYRSIRDIVIRLGRLNVVTGGNGSGKSSLYRSLRLLADTANGQLIGSLAREGGLRSTLWAGPAKPGHHKDPQSLRLGFSSDDYTFTIDLGLPVPCQSAFALDPIIKRECLWRGNSMRPSSLLADRRGAMLRIRDCDHEWRDSEGGLQAHLSMLTEYSGPHHCVDLMVLRETIRSWRFYDHFRTDVDSPARQAQVGTCSPVLSDDGSNLAATLQTILEVGDADGLRQAIEDAFPGTCLSIEIEKTRFQVSLAQLGLKRNLSSAELSDGTLRYLLLLAALFSPRPSELLVFNEPESSLHPNLLPALARAVSRCSTHSQILLVTHSAVLVETLTSHSQPVLVHLIKSEGATVQDRINLLEQPNWTWPAR